MENNKKEKGISLGDIIRVIKKNLILLCIITFIITLIGGVYAFTRKPVYSASSKVMISASADSKTIDIDSTDSLRFTKTYAITVKTSDDIINDVIDDYNNLELDFYKDGTLYENQTLSSQFKLKLEKYKESSINYISARISTSASSESYIVNITFTDEDPDLAVELVNLIVKNSQKEFEYKDESNLGQFADFKISVNSVKSARSAYYSGINKKLYLIIAFLAGVVLAFVVVFIKEFMSNKFKTVDEIESVTDELPIGIFYDNKKKAKDEIINLIEPTIQNYEPYNRLFTNIKYANMDNPYKTILFTSTVEDELKSFIASNLASCINNNGLKVLLIDLDLRKPTAHKTFNVCREDGVIEYVAGEITKDKLIKKTNNGLDVITSGKEVINPFAVLESDKLKSLIEELKSEYDYIILDTAPLAICNDAKLIAKYADGLVYNVTINQVKKKLFMDNVLRLKDLNINIIGYNITKVPTNNDKGYYYYSYKYTEKTKENND